MSPPGRGDGLNSAASGRQAPAESAAITIDKDDRLFLDNQPVDTRDLDVALERHGATRFYPRVDCDVDYELAAPHWIYGVVANLSQEKAIPDLQSQ